MRWLGARLVAVSAVVLCAACGGGGEAVPEVASSPAKDPVVATPPEAEKPESPEGLQAISKILATGRVHRGVTYPMFEEGVLKTVLTAEEMVRVGDDELDLVDMVIETFGEDRQPDYRIDLKTATYHLATEELTSDEETLVTGRNFTIRGDRMIYRSKGGVARMEGNIVMEIDGVESFSMTDTGPGRNEPEEATNTEETK